MIFGSVQADAAEGALLAHGIMLSSGRLAKGTCLTHQHIRQLVDEGVRSVIVARLEEGDLPEDIAAERLAQALSLDAMRRTPASTGRVNLYATRSGLFRADRSVIDRFNRIDPAITIACLADHAAVRAGDMVATIKIIPLAVAGHKVAAAQAVLAGAEPIRVLAYRPHSISLIQTELPLLKPSVLDKTADLLRHRLAASGSVVTSQQRVAHRQEEVAAAIMRAVEAETGTGPRMIVMFGASAVCDAEDVLPQAVRDAGGVVERVGLPVDPGNLLVLGRLGDIPVIVAPGCARSPKENGFDWVLSRLMAGEWPDDDDLSGLGVGGLLMEIPSRPLPRESTNRTQTPQIGILVMAAGRASRMGSAGHKLLAEFDGVPLVRRMAERAVEAADGPVAVVIGYRADAVAASLDGLPVHLVENPDYASGMAGSLKVGLAAAMFAEVDGLMVVLADMPGLSSSDFRALAAAFVEAEGRAIVRAVSGGKRGNPVILPRATFGDLMLLEGDVGARHVIETCGMPIIDVELGQSAHVDVDTPEAVVAAGGVLRE